MAGTADSGTPPRQPRPGSGKPSRQDPYAPMRPKWGRGVARVTAAIILVTFVFAAIAVPGAEAQKRDWGIGDRILIAASGVVIAWLLWRFGTIEARPDKEGILVRNLMTTRRLSWPQIIRVQFGGGAPWAMLDLDDTETLAVMAIQKADGAHGRAMAARLAALIQVHARAPEPPA